ncbi:chlorophyllase-1 [Eurytemora carolleeae]|uniref:chlorophyllase-1 n=1 Tax=Eurytemora carolleeae TaxID=1294199 RepID=UPI000C786F2B|nr:chlorophyllase-1 [Eurytemora carolleeae]|eukprot:XP_023340176.1 chlorophyllase-1-like [Eurytemora affinis]
MCVKRQEGRMKLNSLLIILLGEALAFDPFTHGPYRAKHKTYYGLMNQDLDNMIDVWVPDTIDTVDSPIMVMVGGLGGLMPGVAYSTIFERVTSYGFTVVQPFSANLINNYEGVWLDDILSWVELHLRDKLDEEDIGSGVVLNHRNIFLASHSAGGHVVVEYLKHHCGDVKGSIFMSPVDGFDPFGWIDLFAITPGEYLNYESPALVLMAGLDAQKGTSLTPACAPDDLSNTRFYDAFPGTTWFINATEYGHVDGLEQMFVDGVQISHFCAASTDDVPKEVYRSFLGGEIVTFMSHVLGRETCDISKYMEDPSIMPIKTTVMRKTSTLPVQDECMQGHCQWQEDPFPQTRK